MGELGDVIQLYEVGVANYIFHLLGLCLAPPIIILVGELGGNHLRIHEIARLSVLPALLLVLIELGHLKYVTSLT